MRSRTPSLAILVLLVFASILLLAWRRPLATTELGGRSRIRDFPRIVLWAWERPNDLSFPEARGMGVAFLAMTVSLVGDTITIRPRLQPLTVLPQSPLVAVARVETDRIRRPQFSDEQLHRAASAIARLGFTPGIVGVQVDFDAQASERRFYGEVLREVRQALPPTMVLSITALASWCMDDGWIDGLPVDEAVPMLYRMGPDARDILSRLDKGKDFANRPCRHSVGVSLDEQIPKLPKGRRVYVFTPGSWSRDSVARALAELRL